MSVPLTHRTTRPCQMLGFLKKWQKAWMTYFRLVSECEGQLYKTFIQTNQCNVALAESLCLSLSAPHSPFFSGLVAYADLDERAIDALREFNEEGALAVILQFKESDLSHVQVSLPQTPSSTVVHSTFQKDSVPQSKINVLSLRICIRLSFHSSTILFCKQLMSYGIYSR